MQNNVRALLIQSAKTAGCVELAMLETMIAQEAGVIFDIQRYSIHDGPGIRTTVFVKGCPIRCPWCANPESQRLAPEIEHFRDRCAHCLHCAGICPTTAITESDGEIRLDRDACNMCGRCSEECPADAMKVVGMKATVGEILLILEKDRLFYERSGGGITLSGGEPAAQPEFCAALLRACKSRGFHTAIQTTAHQTWELLYPIITNTDLVLLDIKIMDRALHAKVLGVPNDLILANAQRMVATNKATVVIRVPVVPGYNGSIQELQGIVDFASHIGVREVHLLPYHRLGESKYYGLGRHYELAGQRPPTDSDCRELIKRLQKHDVVVSVGA